MSDKRTIIIDIQADDKQVKELNAQLAKAEKALLDNAKARKELNARIKENGEATEEDIQLKIKLDSENKKLRQSQRLLTKEIDAESNSLNALRARINKLSKERSALNTQTVEGRMRFAELTDELETLNDTINESSKQAGSFKDNIGRYTESILEATESSTNFGFAVGGLGSIVQGVQGAVLGLNTAFNFLAANPLVAVFALIVATLTTAVSIFTDTEKGAAKLAAIFEKLSAVIEPVVNLLTGLGELLVDTFSAGLDFFGGLIGVIGESERQAEQLSLQLSAVNLQLERQEARNKELLAQAEKQRRIRDSEILNFQDRINANEKLGRIEKERLQEALDLEEKKLGILEKQLANTDNEQKKLEINRQVDEQRVKIAEAREDFEGKITEQITEQFGLLKDQADVLNEITNLEKERDILLGNLREGTAEFRDKELESINRTLETSLKRYDANFKFVGQSFEELRQKFSSFGEEAQVVILKAQTETLKSNKELIDAQQDQYQDYLDTVKDQQEQFKANQEALAQERIAGIQAELLQENLALEDSYRLRTELIQAETEAELLGVAKNSNEYKRIIAERESSIREIVRERLDLEIEAQKALNESIERGQELALEKQRSYLEETLTVSQSAFQAVIANEALAYAERISLAEDLTQRRITQIETLQEFELERLRKERDANLEKLQAEIEDEALLEQERLNLLAEYRQQEIDIETNFQDQLTGVLSENTEARIQLSELELNSERNKAMALADIAGNLAQALGEQTALGKIFASAQAGINAGLAVTEALADKTPIPYFLKIANAVAAGVLGLKAIADINAVQVPSGGFAEGGYTGSGGKYEPAGIVHKGERELFTKAST